MKIQIRILTVLALFPASLLVFQGCATKNSKGVPVQELVSTIEKQLEEWEGYTCKVSEKALDPNGGFNELEGTWTFMRPDKSLKRMRLLSAHNREQVGSEIESVCDGEWMWAKQQPPALSEDRKKRMLEMFETMQTQMQSEKRNAEELEELKNRMLKYAEEARYSKWSLKALSKAGMSVRESLAADRNLLDPFEYYARDTLQLQKETRSAWIFTGEHRRMPDWKEQFTIDKKTGFLQRAELILEGEDSFFFGPVILLDVREIRPISDVPETTFQMQIPPNTRVSDHTDMILMNMEVYREMEQQQSLRQSRPASP